MKILVDADACPVKDIIIDTAKEYNVEVIMFSDTSHILNYNNCRIIVVDKGRDSVDFALINEVSPNDIVITQDYGVAAMALSKEAHALNYNGLIFSKDNIDTLLMQRYIASKVRSAGGKISGIKKRNKQNDLNFKKSLEFLIKQIIGP